MKQLASAPRYRATDKLRRTIDDQGLRYDWLAARVGLSKSFFSKVLRQHKTISESDARLIAALLRAEFGVLFEVPGSASKVPFGSSNREAAIV